MHMSVSYPLTDQQIQYLKNNPIVEALKTVYDPEIPVNIYDLGLIYEVDLNEQGIVFIKMTLTSAGCPFAQTLPSIVEEAVNNIPEVVETQVELVWDPPWSKENISEAARLELGLL
jgi:FeS assembly SUF system protein